MPALLRPRAAPLALASLLTACGSPGAQDPSSSTGATTEPASTTDLDPTGEPGLTSTGDPTTSTTDTTSTTSTTATSTTDTTDPTTADPSTTTDSGTTGEPVQPAWLRSFGAPDDQRPGGIGLAPGGGVWVAGDFTGALDLGLGALSGAGTGLYLAHYAADGQPIAARSFFPDSGEPTLTDVSDLAVDNQGAVIVTGWLDGTYTLGGAALTADELDFYVAKYDALGEPLWGQRFGQADWQVSHSVAAGPDDAIWVAGATLAPFMVGDILLTGAASTGMFVVRLDPQGAPIFGKWWGDAGDQEIRGIAACDDGTAAIVGFFTAPLTFGGDTIEPLAGKDIFVARIDSAGQPLWIRAFVGTGTDYATHVDCGEDLRFAAVVTGDATIGTLDITADGDADLVLGRFDLDGTLTWAAAITGAEDQLPTGIARLPDGATAIVLTTAGTATLGDRDYLALGQTDLLFAVYPKDAAEPTQLLGLGDPGPQRGGPLTTRGSLAALAATLSGTVQWPDLPPVTAEGPQDLGLLHFTPTP